MEKPAFSDAFYSYSLGNRAPTCLILKLKIYLDY